MATAATAKWGNLGTILRDDFSCAPQPNINDNECVLLLDNSQLISLCTHLKDKHNVSSLSLINAVEYKEAIQLCYQLLIISDQKLNILYIKANLPKEQPLCIDSISDIWSSANWLERELFDLQGIVFNNHPNLCRLLNPDEWEGHPLQKNYIPPLDALNGPITSVKQNMSDIAHSTRHDVPNQKELEEST